MTIEQETNLREALSAAYPAAAVSDTLRRRVTVLADASQAQAVTQRQRVRRNRLRFAGAGATGLLILTLLLLPRINAVLALTRMADSLRDVRSSHSIQWQVLPDGTRVKTREEWYQAGNWRVEEGDGRQVQVCAVGKRWTYSKAENTVTLEHEALPVGYQGVSGFSVTAGVRDALAAGVMMDIRALGPTTINDRAAHWIQVSDNKYPDARSKVAVDDASNLPLQTDGEERVNGRWVLTSVGVSQYDLSLAASLFVPDFPKTARLIDVEAGRDVWRQRLAKGIVSQARGNDGFTISYVKINGVIRARDEPLRGPRRVVVRNLQTNARGDVYLLYTSGSGVGGSNHLLSAELTDEYGTQYIAPAEQITPTCLEQDPQGPSGSKINGYLFNNEQLLSHWWVPLQPILSSKPHHFTLTLHEDFSTGDTTFTLPIEKPACAVVPEYMPYMARPLPNEWTITHQEAMTRASYYRETRHDLPQALAWYQKAVALDEEDDRRTGYHLAKEQEWFAIYQIQTELGKPEEARVALLKANRDAVYATNTRDQIRAEMKKLGLNP